MKRAPTRIKLGEEVKDTKKMEQHDKFESSPASYSVFTPRPKMQQDLSNRRSSSLMSIATRYQVQEGLETVRKTAKGP